MPKGSLSCALKASRAARSVVFGVVVECGGAFCAQEEEEHHADEEEGHFLVESLRSMDRYGCVVCLTAPLIKSSFGPAEVSVGC
jgi:hypothetical protein